MKKKSKHVTKKINKTQNKAAKEVKGDQKGFSAHKNCDKMAKIFTCLYLL